MDEQLVHLGRGCIDPSRNACISKEGVHGKVIVSEDVKVVPSHACTVSEDRTDEARAQAEQIGSSKYSFSLIRSITTTTYT